MKVLLDTHILVWLATDRIQLSPRELAAIEDEKIDLFLSAISLWELRIKIRSEKRRDRRELNIDPAGAIMFCEGANIKIDDISSADTTLSLAVDPPHGDPFDEMLLVHAQRLKAKLLTRDQKLLGHPLAF